MIVPSLRNTIASAALKCLLKEMKAGRQSFAVTSSTFLTMFLVIRILLSGGRYALTLITVVPQH